MRVLGRGAAIAASFVIPSSPPVLQRLVGGDARVRPRNHRPGPRAPGARVDLVTSRSPREVEVEAVALVCLEALGLPGAEHCRGYIQHWNQRQGAEPIPERSARRVFEAADQILKAGTTDLGGAVMIPDGDNLREVRWVKGLSVDAARWLDQLSSAWARTRAATLLTVPYKWV